ncbi:MAG: hypothetical protein ACTHOH_08260 [Lysobacteraceae bacterium]
MMEAPEVPEVPRRRMDGHAAFRWFEIAMSLSVLCVSAGSLYVALHTGRTMEALVDQNQRLVEANSLPLLMVDHGNARGDGTPELEMTLSNRGVGPARIGWFSMKYDGRVHDSMYALVDAMTPLKLGDPADNARFFGTDQDNASQYRLTTSTVSGRLLSAGEDIRFFGWPKPGTGSPEALDAWNKMDKARWKLDFSACYCSIFGRCWIDELDATTPRAVQSCSVDPRPSLQG